MRETKTNSDDLFSFLDFSDVEDFSMPVKGAFIEFKPRLRKEKRQKNNSGCLKSTLRTLGSKSAKLQ